MTVDNELTHLGERLKQRRLEKNLTLKEIENATSIRMNFLTALEEGEFDKIISPIYAQGFMKKYASYLDLDVEELLAEFPFAMKKLADPSQERADFTLGLGSIEPRGAPANEIKWLPNYAWVIVSVALILGGWLIASYFDWI